MRTTAAVASAACLAAAALALSALPGFAAKARSIAAAPIDAAPVATTAAKKKKCRKGYARKRIAGKTRCVKKRRKARRPSAPARSTDLAQVKQALTGTLWHWTRFDQAGTGGTTDRAHINLCADGTLLLRRSSTTEDGQGDSYTVIIEDIAPSWEVTAGSFDPATGDLAATISATSVERRERTAAQGTQFFQPNEQFSYRLSRRGGEAFLEDQPAFLLDEPPVCTYE